MYTCRGPLTMISVIVSSRKERLERPQADDLVGDLLEHADALCTSKSEALLVDDPAEDLFDLAPDLDLIGQVELGIKVLDDPGLNPELDLSEGFPDGGLIQEALTG